MARLTIPDEQTFAEFTVVTSTSVFPITFSLFAKADLTVKVDGVALDQSDFSFSGAVLDGGGYDGGTVTLNAAVASVSVRIERNVAAARTSNFAPAGSTPVQSVDQALNRQTAISQDHSRRIGDVETALEAVADDVAAVEADRAAVQAIFDVAGEVQSGASVTFLGLGTDAVPLDVQTVLRGLAVSVKIFGAKGDSTGASGSGTDDTAAIQKAFDYAASTPHGCAIFFPRGIYRVTSAININAENKQTHVYGDVAYGSKVFRDSGTAGKTFNIGSATYESDSLIFERLMVGPSQGAGAGGVADTLIHVENRGGIKFRDLLLSGGRQQINLALKGWSTIIERVQFNGSAGNALVTNAADASANHLVVRDCRVFGCGLPLLAVAVQINTGLDVSILQTNFEGNYNALHFNDVDGLLVETGHFERNNQHVYFQATCENVDMNVNYFGEKLGGGVCDMVLEHVTGIDFTNASLYNTAVVFGATAMDVWVGAYKLDGSATMTLPILSSMRRFNKANRNYAYAAPTTGTWERGDHVFNFEPATGGVGGWICVAGGTPGTWVPFGIPGAIQIAAQADSVAATVADLRADFNAFLAKARTSKQLAP